MEQTCGWVGSDLMKTYHDEEWGVPLHDDHKLFEALLLDGHLHTCVIEGVKEGREEQVVGELLELYSLNSK